jgi:transposase
MGRRAFSREYKLQTINQVLEEGKSVTEVSGMLGITGQTIYRWLREHDKYGKEAFKGAGNARFDAEFRIKVLEKQNSQLEQENEILKKYQAFLRVKQKKK